jgi:hypothetical protein
MRLRFQKWFSLFAALALAGNVAAVTATAADSSGIPPAADSSQARALDKERIHGYYSEGSFELVTGALEDFLRRNRAYAREDSLFIYKHLGVVYAAGTASREKGRYYMLRLLETDSAANLEDMYVGDEIQGVFGKVKAEFDLRQANLAMQKSRQPALKPESKPDSGPAATPRAEAPRGKAAPAMRRRSNAGFWIVTGAGLVATGAIAYYILESRHNNATTETVYDVTPPQ